MAECLNFAGRMVDKPVFQLYALTVLPNTRQEARAGQKTVLATGTKKGSLSRPGAGPRPSTYRGSVSPQQAVKRMEGLDMLRHAYLLVKEK
jgi:hypothetical protein